MTVGNMNAMSRPVRNAVSVSSSFAFSNRTRSSGSRTKARTTRIPAICSRRIWFTRSMRDCMSVNCGCMRKKTVPTLRISPGIETMRIRERGPSSRIARIVPPTIVIGATINRVQAISTSICTCCTSLVMRVISDGAPNSPTSRAENPVTLWNRSRRTSRPKLIAARAPQNTAAMLKPTWTSVMASMTPPSFQM